MRDMAASPHDDLQAKQLQVLKYAYDHFRRNSRNSEITISNVKSLFGFTTREAVDVLVDLEQLGLLLEVDGVSAYAITKDGFDEIKLILTGPRRGTPRFSRAAIAESGIGPRPKRSSLPPRLPSRLSWNPLFPRSRRRTWAQTLLTGIWIIVATAIGGVLTVILLDIFGVTSP